MSREFRGPEFAVGHAPPPPQKERREPTVEEKVTWAEAVAKNLHAASEHVTACVAAMTSAHEARDVAAYQSARQSADAGLSQLRELAAAAKEHAHDAKEDRVRTALETAGRLVADAESQWGTAPAAPEPVAPTLACESALLAALPPLRQTGPIGPMFDRARADVARVFREQMPFSDFAAFQRIVREFGDHEIALRFARFSGRTQESLLGILADDHKLRVAARHRESAQRTQSTPIAPAPSATPAREPTSSEPAKDHATPSQVSADDASTVAQRGIQGEGQPLPHGAQIQAAFGKHDVSHLRAHVGGEAGQAARQLGAEAFTTGNDVAFAESPSVDVVAHEATHHVQQRAGVALKNQLDEPGDNYEQQADAIGAKVKRGESVEADLDAIAGTGASATAAPARAVVQRKSADTAASGGSRRDPSGMPLYIDKHQNALRTEVARHLSETAWPDPASDLRWAPGGDHMFSATLWPLVARRLGDVDALRALLPQRKLDERFDQYVGTSAVSAPWSPAFGKAVGQLVEWAVRDALVERVGRRYRSIYASRHEPPEAEELVGGLPIDALVAHALVKCGGVDLFEIPAVEEQQGAAPTAAPSARRERAPQHGRKRALDEGHAASHDNDAPTRAQLMAIEVQIGAKLTAIHAQVARLGFGDEVQAARDVHAHRVLLLDDADAATRKRYLPVLQFQHTQLLAIAPALAEVVPQYWPLRGVPDYALTPKRRSDRDELAAQLEIYARAAAASHDKARSTAILRQLEERARWKERDRIDAAQVSAETAMDEMVSSTHSERVDREGLDSVRKQRQSMLDDTATGRSRFEQQKAATVAHETALRARMASARTALAQLRSAATDVFGEASAMREALGKLDERLKSLPEVILDVSDRITEVDRTWDAAIAARMLADPASKESAPAIQTDPNAPDDWVEWQARAGALPAAQEAFAKIAGDQQLGEFLKTAAKEIRDQAMVDAIVQLAAALAITVVTGMGAAALGRMVAGALIGEALPLAATGTRLAVAGLRIGIDIGVNVSINSAVQIAMSGGEASTGAVVLENALMEVFTRGLMHPLRTAQERALAYSRELSALPNLSAAERRALSRFDFAGTQMSAELLGNMTTQWAARHIVATVHGTGEEVSEPFALTVFQQGAAMGLGKFFHGQVAAWHAHKAALAKTRIGASPAAQQLFAAREAFYARAKELSESLSPDPAAMHELLRMNEALLQQERALVDAHAMTEPEDSPQQNAHEPSSAGSHGRMRSIGDGASEHDVGASDHTHPNAQEPSAGTHERMRSTGDGASEHDVGASDHTLAHETAQSPDGAELATPHLGKHVAAEAGVRYIGEGRFEIDASTGSIAIEVRRTSGHSRVHVDGKHAVIEIERGLAGKELERAVVARLEEVRQHALRADSHAGQEPDPKATSLIERLGAGKAFAEQHAHAPGSVPIDAVLRVVDEWLHITPTERAEQIHLLESLIAEATGRGKKSLEVRDLSRDKTKVRDGVVDAPEKVTIASVSGTADVGLLNKMLEAKRTLQSESDPRVRNLAFKIFIEARDLYRSTIAMQKPDSTAYDTSINTTEEFFVRYKMIVAHGLGTAEIAAQRASARQLGMQELRYGSDKSSVSTLHAEADQLLRNAPMDADVSNTFATTKNRLADPNAAKNEQQLMVEFVKAWEADPTMQRAFNGFESAGVENAKKPPALLWEAAAHRTFRNAIRVREHVAEVIKTPADSRAVAERIARAVGTSVSEAEVMLQRFRTDGYEAAIEATEARAAERRGEGKVATMPTLDPTTSQVAERFAGLSIEVVAADTRLIVESLRTWSAETGVQRGDVTLLGMTMHAGEQLLNKELDTVPGSKDDQDDPGSMDGPFTLLDQVDQAVSLGVDRIGHGLILGIEPEVLIAKGRLKPEDVERFRFRQRQVIEHVRARGVVVEANLSSNTEISNLTQGQHPAGRFAREGLRVTVNTDDETVLATTIQREFERVSRAPGVTRHDIATMMLEGYRSRLGNRELGQRGRLKPQLVDALLHDLSQREAVALAEHLAHYFHVEPHGSSRTIIIRVVDAVLGV